MAQNMGTTETAFTADFFGTAQKGARPKRRKPIIDLFGLRLCGLYPYFSSH